MVTYENTYFSLRITVPDTWRSVSWKHTQIDPAWQSYYQSRDDDLPEKGSSTSKFLFTAGLYSPESEALLDADIEFSVFRLAPSEDFRRSLIKNFEQKCAHYEANGIATSITEEGSWMINGVDFGYIDQESKTRNRHSQYRFLFRRFDEIVWLYVKIAGHKEWAFAEAITIVAGMKCKGASDAEPS